MLSLGGCSAYQAYEGGQVESESTIFTGFDLADGTPYVSITKVNDFVFDRPKIWVAVKPGLNNITVRCGTRTHNGGISGLQVRNISMNTEPSTDYEFEVYRIDHKTITTTETSGYVVCEHQGTVNQKCSREIQTFRNRIQDGCSIQSNGEKIESVLDEVATKFARSRDPFYKEQEKHLKKYFSLGN